jgi:hypothetical protein
MRRIVALVLVALIATLGTSCRAIYQRSPVEACTNAHYAQSCRVIPPVGR